MIINMGPQHPSTHGVLRVMMELDGETVLRALARDRIPAHRHGEDGRGAHLRPGRDERHAHGLPRAALQRARVLPGGRAAARHRGAATRDVDPHVPRRAEPHLVAPAVPGHERDGPRRGLDDAVRLARARAHAALPREDHRPAHEPQLHPARWRGRRPARRLGGGRARAAARSSRRGSASTRSCSTRTRSGSTAPWAWARSRPKRRSRSARPGRSCARPGSPGTSARPSPTSRTTTSTSTSCSARTATSTTGTSSGSTRSSSR